MRQRTLTLVFNGFTLCAILAFGLADFDNESVLILAFLGVSLLVLCAVTFYLSWTHPVRFIDDAPKRITFGKRSGYWSRYYNGDVN